MNAIGLNIKELRKDRKLTQLEFSTQIGIDNSQLSKIEQGKLMPTLNQLMEISSIFDISLDWLTGKGPMLKEDNNLPMASKSANSEGIPLIPLDAMAGISSGEVSVLELDCERYVIPMFKGADFLIPVKGSSMIPKYNSGDIVACKKVPMQDIFFQWNKVYVLDTNQGAIIKRVAKSEEKDCIKIVSENPNYEPFDLHLSQIYSIAIVIGVVRQE